MRASWLCGGIAFALACGNGVASTPTTSSTTSVGQGGGGAGQSGAGAMGSVGGSAADGSSGVGASGGAPGVGGGAAHCTNAKGDLTFTLPGYGSECGLSQVEFTAIVTASASGSMTFDTCLPGQTCNDSIGTLTYAADGLDHTVPVGAIVHLHGGSPPLPASECNGGSLLVVSNVPSWEGVTNPFSGAVWLILWREISGIHSGPLVATPFTQEAVPLPCGNNQSSGGGDCAFSGTGDWARTLFETAHPQNSVTLFTGDTALRWSTDDGTYDVANLGSWAHDQCVAADIFWMARSQP